MIDMFLRLKLWLAAAGAVLVAIVSAYWRGRQDEAGDEYERELNEYVETRKRIDGVHIDDAQRWLRDRAEQGGDL